MLRERRVTKKRRGSEALTRERGIEKRTRRKSTSANLVRNVSTERNRKVVTDTVTSPGSVLG